MPLVLARVACSRFTLKAITPDCSVAAALELLPGVGQEPGDAIDDWEQVQYPFYVLDASKMHGSLQSYFTNEPLRPVYMYCRQSK